MIVAIAAFLLIGAACAALIVMLCTRDPPRAVPRTLAEREGIRVELDEHGRVRVKRNE